MKIVIAPDSYKESLSALGVAHAIERGFRAIFPLATYVSIPLADGGEGTVEAMIGATGGTKVNENVTGPLGTDVAAFWGLSGDGKTAFIEMAAASGLELVPPALRDPLRTTSFGTGQLIRAALASGVSHIIIGIGGSATNDGGAGMVQALGARLLDRAGNDIGRGGGSLSEIAAIDMRRFEPRVKQCRIDVACDVTNPLTGPNGASWVFGPQKGATPAVVELLDNNLRQYARVIKHQLNIEVDSIVGAGAAGGMGAALLAFCGARLRKGIEIVTEALELERHIKDCDLVVTGEGRIDGQSINGKVPIGVAAIAKKHRKPVIGIAGSLSCDVDVVYQQGIDAVFSVIYEICSLEQAMLNASDNVTKTARNVAAALQCMKGVRL